MNDPIAKLNAIYEDFNSRTIGSFHNCLWQVLVNDSLKGDQGAFVQLPTHRDLVIALGSGGYIPAGFEVHVMPDNKAATISALNERVFGLDAEKTEDVIVRSMRSI